MMTSTGIGNCDEKLYLKLIQLKNRAAESCRKGNLQLAESYVARLFAQCRLNSRNSINLQSQKNSSNNKNHHTESYYWEKVVLSHYESSSGQLLLHTACALGSSRMLAMVLNVYRECDGNGSLNLNAFDMESGWSPVHHACFNKRVQNIQLLMKVGCSLLTFDQAQRIIAVELLPVYSLGDYLFSSRNTVEDVKCVCLSVGSNESFQLGVGPFSRKRECASSVPLFLNSSESTNRSIQQNRNGQTRKSRRKQSDLTGSDETQSKSSEFDDTCVRVSAGNQHSLFLCESGRVWGVGIGNGGRLLSSDTRTLTEPECVWSETGKFGIVQVATSNTRSAVVTQSGAVYESTGKGFEKKTDLKMCVKEIAIGENHCLVRCGDNGDIYGWGNNQYGQLGENPRVRPDSSHARAIPSLLNRKTCAVATSSSSRPLCAVILASSKSPASYSENSQWLSGVRSGEDACASKESLSGDIYVWGDGEWNMRRIELNRWPGNGEAQIFVRHLSNAPGPVRAVKVALGDGLLAALSTEGEVYICNGMNLWARKRAIEARLVPWVRAKSIDVSGKKVAVCDISGCLRLYSVSLKSENMKPIATISSVTLVQGVYNALSVSIAEQHTLVVASVESTPKKFAYDSSKYSSVPSLRSMCEKVVLDSLLSWDSAWYSLELAALIDADHYRGRFWNASVQFICENLAPLMVLHAQEFLSTDSRALELLEEFLDPASIRYRDQSVSTEHFDEIPVENASTMLRRLRAAKKKLCAIERLERRLTNDETLNDEETAKVSTKVEVEQLIMELSMMTSAVSVPLAVSESIPASPTEQQELMQRKESLQSLSVEPGESDRASEVELKVGSSVRTGKRTKKREGEKRILIQGTGFLAGTNSSAVRENQVVSESISTSNLSEGSHSSVSLTRRQACWSQEELKSTLNGSGLDDVQGEGYPENKSLSFREIQELETLQKRLLGSSCSSPATSVSNRFLARESDDALSSGSYSLGSILSSEKKRLKQSSNRNSWKASESNALRRSMKDIVDEEEKRVATASKRSEEEKNGQNRWYLPEPARNAKQLKHIVTEEQAMRELASRYKDVTVNRISAIK